MHRRLRYWGMVALVAAGFANGALACSTDDDPGTAGIDAGGEAALQDSRGDSGGVLDAVTTTPLDCEVAIVGGGPGGLHTAYKLSNPPAGMTVVGVTSGAGVCLFEKEDRLGGRIRDVAFGPGADDVTGTGANRLYDNQYTAALATELGVTLATPIAFSNLRGLHDPLGDASVGQVFGYGGDAFKSLYGVTENDDEMRSRLLCGDQVPKDGANRPSFAGIAGIASKSTVDYANDVLGSAGARYFFDNNRFRADFSADVDAVGYLEYAVVDRYGAGATKYPIPGFSTLVNKMKSAIEQKGGRIFLSDPVNSVASNPDGAFTLVTKDHTVTAKQVVLAIPHGALAKLTGDVITSITAQKEYGSVTSAKSMQVTHQWDKQWWKGDLRYPDNGKRVGADLPDGSAPILRADTTIVPNGYCLDSIEMPYTEHHDALKVTRTVHSEDRTCVDKNLALYGNGGAIGAQAFDIELTKLLRILFPTVFDGTPNEPQIVKTDVHVHDEARFYLKKGATANGVTNKSIFDWSSSPIAGKQVYLVSDAWYPLGSGWSNAAYISSIRVLNDHFGFSLPKSELENIACP